MDAAIVLAASTDVIKVHPINSLEVLAFQV